MLKIAKSSGNVTLGIVGLTPRYTFQDFLERRGKDLDCTETHSHVGMIHRQCRLPTFMVEPHEWFAEVLFSNRFAAFISTGTNEIDYETYCFDGNSERWKKQLDWMDTCREILHNQLGEPHFVELPYLHNEQDFLSHAQLAHLVEWTYKFTCGDVKISYDSMSQSSSLFIKYDHFQQIASWDDLTTECEYRVQVETSHGGSGVQMLFAILDAIELLRHYFMFDQVLPIITDSGLSVELLGRFVSIKVVHKENAIRYYISRSDKVGKSQADYTTLVDTLKKYAHPDVRE